MDQPAFEIRSMHFVDAAPLSNLMSEIIPSLDYYNDWAKMAEIEKYSAGALLKIIEEDPEAVLIALVEGKVTGFCVTYYDDGIIWLSWIGVHRDYRGRRIAQKLLAEMEQRVPKRAAHKIWCDCRTVNEPSKKLLSGLGFRQLCTVENHWYGQDFILWEKTVL